MAREEIPDSDSDFSSDDNELPSLEALFKKGTGDAGKVFTKSTRVLSSDPIRTEEDRQETWANFMGLIRDGKDDDLAVDNPPVAAPQRFRSSSTASSSKSDKEGNRHLIDEAVNLVKGSADVDMNSDEDQHWDRVRLAMDRQASTRAAPFYYFFREMEEDKNIIKCPCGFKKKEVGKACIYCKTCNTWQHIECFYPDHEEEALQPGFMHWCDECKPPSLVLPQYSHELFRPAEPHHFSLALKTGLVSKFSSTGIAINVPDELLMWIIRAYPSAQSDRKRAEYSRILLENRNQVRDLVDVNQIKVWFLSTGATHEAITLRAKGSIATQRKPGRDRIWKPFQNVLELLSTCCGCFHTDTLICAVVLLLRVSMDSEVRVNATILAAVVQTLSSLTSSVHETRREYFCEKVCGDFIPSVNSGYLLSRAVEATSHFTPVVLETGSKDKFPSSGHLRIRLQLAVFFHSRDGNHHNLSLSQLLDSILDRLEDPSFKARPGTRGDINCYDLDGYGLALSELLPYCRLLRSREKDKVKLKEIDELINMVRRKVTWINSTIQIQGPQGDYDVRYEAKARLSYLDLRMSYFFPRRNAGIFGNDDREESERRALKAGQGFMANFLKKRKEKENLPTPNTSSPAKAPAKKVEFDDRPMVLGSPRKPMKIAPSPSPRKLKSGKEFMASLRNKRKAATAGLEGDENKQPDVRRTLFEKKEKPEAMDSAEPAMSSVPISPERIVEHNEFYGFDEPEEKPAVSPAPRSPEGSMVYKEFYGFDGAMDVDMEQASKVVEKTEASEAMEKKLEASNETEEEPVMPARPTSPERLLAFAKSLGFDGPMERDTEPTSAPEISKQVEVVRTEEPVELYDTLDARLAANAQKQAANEPPTCQGSQPSASQGSQTKGNDGKPKNKQASIFAYFGLR